MIVSDYNKNFDYEFRQALDNLYNKSQLGPDEFKITNDPNQPCIKCDLRHYGCMNTCLIYSRFIRKKLGPDEFKITNDPNQPCIKCDLRHYGCMNTCLIYSRFIRKKLGLPTDEIYPISVLKITYNSEK